MKRAAQAERITMAEFVRRTPDGKVIRDDEGVDLADIDTAVREAASTAESFAADRKLGGDDYSGCVFEIRSDNGEFIAVPAFDPKTLS